jgi:hypothetical protein
MIQKFPSKSMVVVSRPPSEAHAFINETELTLEEWTRAIQFLTRTGHMSNDWR